jgi:DNA-binding CsgD family transcriptional regulator
MTEHPQTDLSERELEILRLVATGASNKEIAFQLSISANTVKVHLRNIFGKIGVASRTEAAMYAVKAGLVEGKSVVDNAIMIVEEAPSLKDEVQINNATALAEKIQPRRYRLWVGGIVVFAMVIMAVLFWRIRTQINSAAALNASQTNIPLERWQQLADMPTARSGSAAVAYEGRIYVIAGETENGVTGVVEQYDPVSNHWETLSSKPVAVSDASAVVIGGKIYIPGGRLESGLITATLEIYDPVENRWSVGKPLPHPISAYGIAAYEGRLYVFGGWDGNEYLATTYQYDPIYEEWQRRTDMPTPRASMAVAVTDSRIDVMGGFNGAVLDKDEIYSPSHDAGQSTPWQTSTPLPEGRYAVGSAVVADIIHIIGGKQDGQKELFGLQKSPQSAWQYFTAPSLPGWAAMALIPLEGKLYAFGGEVAGHKTANVWRYQAIYTIVIPILK